MSISHTEQKSAFKQAPGYLAKLTELKPGDILLFRPSYKLAPIQYLIMGLQAVLSHQQHGHYDTMHVAICVGQVAGKAMIAHVTEVAEKMKYVKEDMDTMISREEGVQDRSFLVFRPKDKRIGEAYAKQALKKKNRHRSWSITSGFKTFLQSSRCDHSVPVVEKERMDKYVICSQFIIDVIKGVTQNQEKVGFVNHLSYYPKIRSTSSPKTLEAELYNNVNYQLLCYTGKNSPYFTLKQEIKAQLKRLKAKKGSKQVEKYTAVLNQYRLIRKKIKVVKFKNELEKATYLLKEVLPVLSIRVGWFEAQSYKQVMGSARKLGIFSRDLEQCDSKAVEAKFVKAQQLEKKY